MFTAPTWQRVLVLVIGAVLSPGRRTVAAIHYVGLDQDSHSPLPPCSEPQSLASRRVAQCRHAAGDVSKPEVVVNEVLSQFSRHYASGAATRHTALKKRSNPSPRCKSGAAAAMHV